MILVEFSTSDEQNNTLLGDNIYILATNFRVEVTSEEMKSNTLNLLT